MSFSIYLFLLLIIVLSLDAFTAGLSYGVEKVHVPLSSLLTIATLSGLMLTFSMSAGNLLLDLIPVSFTKILSFTILFLLSLYKFYDAFPSPQKKALTTNKIAQKINNTDISVLSKKEAFFLGLALSIDNVSAGLCTGTASLPPLILLLITTIIHILSIKSGLLVGTLLAEKASHRFAWLGAAILLVLSFFRLF